MGAVRRRRLGFGNRSGELSVSLSAGKDRRWTVDVQRRPGEEGNAGEANRRQRVDGHRRVERDGGRTDGVFQQTAWRRPGAAVCTEIPEQRGQAGRAVLESGGGRTGESAGAAGGASKRGGIPVGNERSTGAIPRILLPDF